MVSEKSSGVNTLAIITNTIRRDASYVEKSLRASLSQPNVQSVTLVDQNKTPLILAYDIIQDPKLKIVHHCVPAVSQARNLAPYPDVDWLMFCDDDGYMTPDYVSQLHQVLAQNPKAEVICGSIKRMDTGDFYSKRHAVGGDMSRFWNAKLLMGSNFCVKRSVFESLGKFDESFGAGAIYGSSEETDFAWTALFHHHPIIYAPELVVFHVPPFEGKLWPEMKKAFRYGRGKSALVKKWLWKGHLVVLLEAFEMFVVPIVRIFEFIVRFRFKEILIQIAAVLGRFYGLLTF